MRQDFYFDTSNPVTNDGNRPLSNCVFEQTKENLNLSPHPRLCSFVLTQFKTGLLREVLHVSLQ